jgi:hypothetical protein
MTWSAAPGGGSYFEMVGDPTSILNREYFYGTLAGIAGECQAQPEAQFTVATAEMELFFDKDTFDTLEYCTAAATPKVALALSVSLCLLRRSVPRAVLQPACSPSLYTHTRAHFLSPLSSLCLCVPSQWMGYVRRFMKNRFMIRIDAWQAMVAISVSVLDRSCATACTPRLLRARPGPASVICK